MVFKSIEDALNWAEKNFNSANLYYGHGTDNAWDDAVALTLHALNLPIDADPSILKRALTVTQSQHLMDLYQQRLQHRIPVPYLTNQAWFCSLPFYVDKRVIIPRSPLAELVEQQFNPWIKSSQVNNILDLCSGSACIAIACAYAFPEAKVDALELSEEALAVAKINIRQHQLTQRVRLLKSDIFSALSDEKYDIIVSNPPYVNAEDFARMPSEFTKEPVMALISGEDGLNITRLILANAAKYLTEQGILVVEVGNSAAALTAAYVNLPFTWLEFSYGGEGVFLLTKLQLETYQHMLTK